MADQPGTESNPPSNELTMEVPEARPVTPPTEPLGFEPALPIEAPARPRVWTVFLAYFGCVGVSLIVGVVALVSVAVAQAGAEAFSRTSNQAIETALGTPAGMLGMLFSTIAVLVFGTLLAAALSPVRWTQRLRLRASGFSAHRVAMSALGAIGISSAFSSLYEMGLLPRSLTLEPIGAVVAAMSGWKGVLAVVVIGLGPGFSEEFLFRGYIQTRLTERWGARRSIAIVAFMFALFHMDLAQGILALAVGVYLGVLTERTGSIIPAMICHAANNTFATLMALSCVEVKGPYGNCGILAAAVMLAWLGGRHALRREVPATVSEPLPPEIH